MANEKDRSAPAAPPPAPAVEGATKQFSLKMAGWLTSLGADLDAPAGAPPVDPLDELLQQAAPKQEAPKPEAEAPQIELSSLEEEDISLEAALFKSEPPPKP